MADKPIMTVQNAAAFLYMALMNDDADVDEAVNATSPINFGLTLREIAKDHPAMPNR